MNRADFNPLVLAHLDEITAFARRRCRRPADADDLVQATYERAFSRWRSLRDAASARAWLFRIARNLEIDRARSRAVRPELRVVDAEQVSGAAFIDASAVERLEARALEAAFARLPDEQREAVLLCDLWGFRYEEIAGIVDAPIGTVRSRIARGRARLGSLLARDLGRASGGAS